MTHEAVDTTPLHGTGWSFRSAMYDPKYRSIFFQVLTIAVLVGIVIENIDRDLEPVQVIRYSDDDGTPLEEVRYLQPTGIALQFDEVRRVIDELAEQLRA
jgi:hypothetical protein